MPICNFCGEECKGGWRLIHERESYFFCTLNHLIVAVLVMPCFATEKTQDTIDQAITEEEILKESQVARQKISKTVVKLLELIYRAFEAGKSRGSPEGE